MEKEVEMKRAVILVTATICFLLLVLVSAMTWTLSAMPPMQEPRPTPRIPNYAYYTKRCWPGCHYDPAVMSEEPHTYLHNFEGELPSGWGWINEDSTHWTLTESPGALRIVSQPGSISGDLRDASNVLVRDAPSGHFDVVTRVTFDPTDESQSAGVFVQFGDAGVISLTRGYGVEGQGVYFDGSDLGCGRAVVPTTEEEVYLMLRKAGNSYIGYYGLGNRWAQVGRCYDYVQTPSCVGLAVASADPGALEIPADFDLISVVERP
jgi:hypothetical protein